MRLLVVILLWGLGFSAYAQQVVVKDSLSSDPLSGVIIYNEQRTTLTTTDSNGEADLDRFGAKELLFFRHMGHGLLKRQKSNIQDRAIVLLIAQSEGLDEIVVSASRFAEVAPQITRSHSKNRCARNSINPATDCSRSAAEYGRGICAKEPARRRQPND